MPYTDRELRQAAREWHKRQTLDLDIPAIIQDSTGLPAGKVNVWRTDIRQTVIVNGVIRTPGIGVWLREMKNKELQIFAVNVADTALIFGDATGTVTQPPVIGELIGTVWEEKNLAPGLIRPNYEGGLGMTVRVQPLTYKTQVIVGVIAVTAPPVSGQRWLAVIYWNPVTAALGVTYSDATTRLAASFTLYDVVAVPIETDWIRLGAALLEYGQTDVDGTTRLFYSRDWLVTEGATSTDFDRAMTDADGSVMVDSSGNVMMES